MKISRIHGIYSNGVLERICKDTSSKISQRVLGKISEEICRCIFDGFPGEIFLEGVSDETLKELLTKYGQFCGKVSIFSKESRGAVCGRIHGRFSKRILEVISGEIS